MEPRAEAGPLAVLEEVADATLLVDNHAHPFWLPDERRTTTTAAASKRSSLLPLHAVLTEAAAITAAAPAAVIVAAQSPRSAFAFRRSLRDMHALLLPPPPQLPRDDSSASADDRSRAHDDDDDDDDLHAPARAQWHARRDEGEGEGGWPATAPVDPLALATPLEEAVERARERLGPAALAARCFAAAGLAAVLIDDGLPAPPGSRPVALHALPTAVARRVLRLEREAELLLARLLQASATHGLDCGGGSGSGSGSGGGGSGGGGSGHLASAAVETQHEHGRTPDVDSDSDAAASSEKRARTAALLSAARFFAAFERHLEKLPGNVVAFKSVAAYRCGLCIRLDWPPSDVDAAFERHVALARAAADELSHAPLRITDKPLVDTVVRIGLLAARRHAIPLQVHCGFGDADLHLPDANPALLRPVFQAFPDVPIVLLHAAWPYTRVAAYLTSVYPRVFLDFGLAIPLLSTRGMFRALDEAMEIAPLSKLLYSSDAHSVPDAFYLAARWGRRTVAAVLAAAVSSGDMSETEAKAAVRNILADNAIRLYNLPVSS